MRLSAPFATRPPADRSFFTAHSSVRPIYPRFGASLTNFRASSSDGVFPQLVSRKLYITGESYAGMYIPYISHRILSASPLEKTALQLNLTGILINDGVYSSQYATLVTL